MHCAQFISLRLLLGPMLVSLHVTLGGGTPLATNCGRWSEVLYTSHASSNALRAPGTLRKDPLGGRRRFIPLHAPRLLRIADIGLQCAATTTRSRIAAHKNG